MDPNILKVAPDELIETNLVELALCAGQWSDSELTDQGDALLVSSSTAHPLWNAVVAPQFTVQEAEDRVEQVIDHFRSRHLPHLWWVSPAARPVGLGSVLEGHGVTAFGGLVGMTADLESFDEPRMPAGTTIARAPDLSPFLEWMRPDTKGYEQPAFVLTGVMDPGAEPGMDDERLRHYVAKLDGEAAGCVTMFLGPNVAGLYNLTVHPSLGDTWDASALAVVALLEARALGYGIGVTLGTRRGRRLFERMGFAAHGRIRQYLWMELTDPQKPPAGS